MAYAKYERAVQDAAGNLVAGVYVEVRRESDNALVSLYSGPAGGALANPAGPFDGKVRFYAAGAMGGLKVRVYGPGVDVTYRNEAAGNMAELDTDALSSLVREVLTADRNYYVRTDGNNGNSGLVNSAGGAFLTLQYAIDVVAALDRSIYNVTIQLGAGTFTSGGAFTGMGPGSGFIQINGSGIATTTIATSGGFSHNCIMASNTRRLRIANMRLETTATNSSCIRLDKGAELERLENVDFGPASYGHMVSLGQSMATVTFNYTISGGAPYHVRLEQGGGYFVVAGNTVTLTGTPNFSVGFVRALTNSYVVFSGVTWSGSATGRRYDTSNGGVVQSSNTLPGDTAGLGTNFGVSPWGLYA